MSDRDGHFTQNQLLYRHCCARILMQELLQTCQIKEIPGRFSQNFPSNKDLAKNVEGGEVCEELQNVI